MEHMYPKKTLFVCIGQENGLEPIGTMRYFHFLPLEKDPWQRCHTNWITEKSMKAALTSEGVTANKKEAFSSRFQSITSFCPRVTQVYPSKQRNCLNMGSTPTKLLFNFGPVKTKPSPHLEYKAEDSRLLFSSLDSILAIVRHGRIYGGPKCARHSARPSYTLCHKVSWTTQ